MNLSPRQLQKLQEAIVSAFPNQQQLEMMVFFELGQRLNNIAFGQTYPNLVFNLITGFAEPQGKLDDLIEASYRTVPNNPKLKEFYQSVTFRKGFIIDSQEKTIDLGPDIQWRGEIDEIQLQGWLKPEPDYWDVGFLQRALAQSSAVCRIEIPTSSPDKKITGTGVLIAPDKVLTNYHVLIPEEEYDLTTNALNAVLKFGCFTADNGLETTSRSFQLDRDKPILHFSKTENLDYILLQVESSIKQTTEIKPARWDGNKLPHTKMGISLLQHPEGESMKLSVSQDGITGVYQDSGLVQYINKTASGSSGSPCFDEDWYFVALHHAQRAKTFGIIREGILFTAIYQEIKDYLN